MHENQTSQQHRPQTMAISVPKAALHYIIDWLLHGRVELCSESR